MASTGYAAKRLVGKTGHHHDVQGGINALNILLKAEEKQAFGHLCQGDAALELLDEWLSVASYVTEDEEIALGLRHPTRMAILTKSLMPFFSLTLPTNPMTTCFSVSFRCVRLAARRIGQTFSSSSSISTALGSLSMPGG